MRKLAKTKKFLALMHHICFVYIHPLNGNQEFNSFEEPCLTQVATITSFAWELNPTGVGEHQKGDIFTLNYGSLKLMYKFTYLGSSVSSTENDINTWLAKEWTAIDRLSVNESQTYPIRLKAFFSKQRSCPYHCMDAPHGRWLRVLRKSLKAIAHWCYELY